MQQPKSPLLFVTVNSQLPSGIGAAKASDNRTAKAKCRRMVSIYDDGIDELRRNNLAENLMRVKWSRIRKARVCANILQI